MSVRITGFPKKIPISRIGVQRSGVFLLFLRGVTTVLFLHIMDAPVCTAVKKRDLTNKKKTMCFIRVLTVPKERVSSVLCPSAHPHVSIRLPLDGFPLNLIVGTFFNLLKTKRNLLYVRNQSVPRCKHLPPRL
jgi:hypothetical protein